MHVATLVLVGWSTNWAVAIRDVGIVFLGMAFGTLKGFAHGVFFATRIGIGRNALATSALNQMSVVLERESVLAFHRIARGVQDTTRLGIGVGTHGTGTIVGFGIGAFAVALVGTFVGITRGMVFTARVLIHVLRTELARTKKRVGIDFHGGS